MRKLVDLPFKVAKEMVGTQWLPVPQINQHDARQMSLGLARFPWKRKITWLDRWNTCCLILTYIGQFMVYKLLYVILIKLNEIV